MAGGLSGLGGFGIWACENDDFAWEVLQKWEDGDTDRMKNVDFAWEVLPKWQDDDVKRTCR